MCTDACRNRITCTITCATVFYPQIENGNIANQIHGFTIDYGKFILIIVIIHQIFSLARDWSKCVTWANFQNCARCVKDLKDNKDNSLHLGRKYARIFVLGHYLFLVAHSFPRATLSENCLLLGTDNVRGQIF